MVPQEEHILEGVISEVKTYVRSTEGEKLIREEMTPEKFPGMKRVISSFCPQRSHGIKQLLLLLL